MCFLYLGGAGVVSKLLPYPNSHAGRGNDCSPAPQLWPPLPFSALISISNGSLPTLQMLSSFFL